MKVFIAGIMQGSRMDRYIDDQDYRRIISETLRARRADVEIMDPNELHPNGVDYDDELAKATLLEMAGLASQADLVVAYVPQASMGTALEMWKAFEAGVPLVTVSPMAANWVIKHLSSVVLPDLDAFRRWVADGGFDKLLNID
ncbi:MAG: hypothetical protein ACK2UU_00530 [Anaerolineae bacterium]